MLSNYKEDERKGRHELWSRHSVSINCQVAAFDMTTIKPRAKESGSVWPTNYCLGNCQRHSLGFSNPNASPPQKGCPRSWQFKMLITTWHSLSVKQLDCLTNTPRHHYESHYVAAKSVGFDGGGLGDLGGLGGNGLSSPSISGCTNCNPSIGNRFQFPPAEIQLPVAKFPLDRQKNRSLKDKSGRNS